MGQSDDYTPNAAELGAVTTPYPSTFETSRIRMSSTISPSSTSIPTSGLLSANGRDNEEGLWGDMSTGVKAAIVLTVIVGVVVIVLLSIWCCCCKGRRRRREMRRQERRMLPESSMQSLPLRTIHSSDSNVPHPRTQGFSTNTPVSMQQPAMAIAGDAPPPRYSEIVPQAHMRLAGGTRSMPEDDDSMGVISDGKTPLSEIPFEDVVLQHTVSQGSSSSSRDFGQVHGMGGGDTRGHTNS